jgi:hypothetical protein
MECKKTMRCLGVAAARWILPHFLQLSEFFQNNFWCYAPVLPRALLIWVPNFASNY